MRYQAHRWALRDGAAASGALWMGPRVGASRRGLGLQKRVALTRIFSELCRSCVKLLRGNLRLDLRAGPQHQGFVQHQGALDTLQRACTAAVA